MVNCVQTSKSGCNSETLSPRAMVSRITGAKSKGPRTAEGKARGCRNAITHGMRSADPLMLVPSDREAYELFRADLALSFGSVSQEREAMFETFAINAWRWNALVQLEAEIIQRRIAAGMQLHEYVAVHAFCLTHGNRTKATTGNTIYTF